MSSTKSKKSRNPTVVDNWLDSLGYYRKNVAYDETCFFRAVSEQLFECQIYHERVRKDCIEYGRRNFLDFIYLLENLDQWFDHLDLLEKHMVVCGNLEINLISSKYKCDVIVFDANRQDIMDVTGYNYEKTILLCLMNEDHYDVVHEKEYIQTIGFCQSIVYNILYENVFEVPNVQDIVRGMLYNKEFVAQPFAEPNNNENQLKSDKDSLSEDNTVVANIAPFPFKIAKALDPTIYRNIEYDSWTEIRRELRLGDWYYGDHNLILGTRCILNEANYTYDCYIQEIIKEQNKCVVYVTKLAEKRTVNYTDLSPENDAKPWPLPYRFTKNLALPSIPNDASDKVLKAPKKRKEKRRVKSSPDTQALNLSESNEHDVDSFIGIPLHMQDPSQGGNQLQPDTSETTLSQHNLLITPDVSSPLPKFSWEAPWSPEAMDNTMWSQNSGISSNMVNYNLKPMVASAPVTPNIIPYHDTQYPYAYNYHIENYQNFVSQNSEISTQEETKTQIECYEESTQIYNDDYESSTSKELPPLTIPTSNQQPVEVFSPILPVIPGAPIIYTQPPGVYDRVMPGPPFQVYTPPVDVQYISPPPYFYSPTISTTWYPMGINAQGFIFPTPANPNLQSHN